MTSRPPGHRGGLFITVFQQLTRATACARTCPFPPLLIPHSPPRSLNSPPFSCFIFIRHRADFHAVSRPLSSLTREMRNKQPIYTSPRSLNITVVCNFPRFLFPFHSSVSRSPSLVIRYVQYLFFISYIVRTWFQKYRILILIMCATHVHILL